MLYKKILYRWNTHIIVLIIRYLIDLSTDFLKGIAVKFTQMG